MEGTLYSDHKFIYLVKAQGKKLGMKVTLACKLVNENWSKKKMMEKEDSNIEEKEKEADREKEVQELRSPLRLTKN